MDEDRARTEILARVRRASGGRTEGDILQELARLDTGPPPRAEGDELATRFLARVEANGGSVATAADRSGIVTAVAEYLRKQFRSSKLVAGNEPRLAALPWREAGVLPRFGGARDGDAAAISYAALAVAETGSIVTYTGRGNPAAHNLLAEAHIVLVDLCDLYATLEAAYARIRREMDRSGRPRGINFIAGPSSTADVEATLVQGAHGPRRWHVILVSDPQQETPGDTAADSDRDSQSAS